MGNTWPFLVLWMILLPASIVSNILLGTSVDLQLMTKIVGIGSLVYMGLEYSIDFLKNKELPKGQGSVENMNRNKWVVSIWIGYAFITVILNSVLASEDGKDLINNEDLSTVILWAGTITIEFLAGNKGNSLATNALGSELKIIKCDDTKIDNTVNIGK